MENTFANTRDISSNMFVKYNIDSEDYYPITIIEDAFQPEVIAIKITNTRRGIIEWIRILSNSNIYKLRINNNDSYKDIKCSKKYLLEIFNNGLPIKPDQF